MKINRYTCEQNAKKNINYFHGIIYASSREAALSLRTGKIPAESFALRAENWGIAVATASAMFRNVEKGSNCKLGL